MTTLTPPFYPSLLKAIPQAPNFLYVEGNTELLKSKCVSVVGSRKLTAYAEQVLRLIIPVLVHAGLTIVSGLAYGADALAHTIALQYEGKCIAVLGAGLEKIYPSYHRPLAKQIVETGGCLVSEYPASMEPLPYHFPQRNRIISGLSAVTVVVQAGEKSGTISTCMHALQQGRDICVVLGDITREEYKGCYWLAKQGAHIVSTPADIVQHFNAPLPLYTQMPLKPALTGTGATLYDCILRGITQVEKLQSYMGLTATQLQGALSLLELDGYITLQNNTWHVIS